MTTEQRPVGWWAATVRALVPWGFIPLIWLLPTSLEGPLGGVVFVAWMLVVYGPILNDPQRRGLHDQLAGTRVVADVPLGARMF